jgi:VWFA-related protein
MTPRFTIAIVVLSSLPVIGGRAQDRPVFRSTSAAVRVDVSVQRNGRPVTGLTVADFELRDNDVVQRVGDFSYEKLPIDVAVALDVSQSVTGDTLQRLQRGVEQLQKRLTPQDRLKLVTFNMRVTRLFDFAGAETDTASLFSRVQAAGTTSILDTIAVLLAAPADIDRRQLVIVFSDGQDTGSLTDNDISLSVAGRSRAAITIVRPLTQVTQLTTMAAGANNGTQSYAIPAAQISVRRTVSPPLASIFGELAAETGGTVLQPSPDDNLTNIFSDVLDEFRSSYVLTFIPSGVSDHGRHALAVRITRDGTYAVRARRSYIAD